VKSAVASDVVSFGTLALLVAVDLGRPKRPRPTELPIVVSTSAKARECSNIDIPVSVFTGMPCREQERVSTKWLTHNDWKTGQSKERDPYVVWPPFIISTASQQPWSSCQKSRFDDSQYMKPPSLP
jgi:hypothetical protein